MLEIRVHPRRGRGLYTTRKVLGGETVLSEAPTLLLVPSAMHNVTCATCLRMNKDGHVQCQGCGQASFCSAECAQAGAACAWIHGPGICSTYRALASHTHGLDEQDLDAGRFLTHVLAVAASATTSQHAAATATALYALQGSATDIERRVVTRLLPVIQSVAQGPLPLSPDQMSDLLRKEQHNSYGILAPAWYSDPQGKGVQGDASSDDGDDGDRVLRGSALYRLASLINHECNPNVARFDHFDAQGPNHTHMVFRAMHDLPAGTEVMQSYCQLSWDYEERQEHLQSVYGFKCGCQRCKLEQTWTLTGEVMASGADGMDDDSGSGEWETDDEPSPEDGDTGDGGDMSMEGVSGPDMTSGAVDVFGGADVAGLLAGGANEYVQISTATWPVQPDEGDQGPLDAMYLQLYLLKYVCAVPGCLGTLAPQAPGSALFECSVCGAVRSEAQFIADLEG